MGTFTRLFRGESGGHAKRKFLRAVVLLQIKGGKTVDVREFTFDYEANKKAWEE